MSRDLKGFSRFWALSAASEDEEGQKGSSDVTVQLIEQTCRGIEKE